MTKKPEKRPGESWLAFYNRTEEWEKIARKEAAIESRLADRLALRSKYSTEKAVTRQVERDRITLHDLAANNDVLRKVLRRMQS